MGVGWQLALVGVLVVLNAVFAGSEIALISLREGQLRRMEQMGRRGRAAVALAEDPNRFLATIQIGITLAGFLASATAAVALAAPLVEPLAFLGGAARPAAVVLVTAALTFLTLVLGELAPKRIALQRAEGWALMVAQPLSLLAVATRPVVWLLSIASDTVVRLSGADPSHGRDVVTDEEIRELVATAGSYTRAERQVITGALEATDRTLRQVLRPRTMVVALKDTLTVEEGIQRLVEAGHSRAPVYAEHIDDADRVVTLLDLVRGSGTVGAQARTAVVLPESVMLVPALRTLQANRQSMALIVSEYGGIEGIATIEDLVEEFVGEIHDEFDRDVREAVSAPDGTVVVVGHFPVHDLVDLGVTVPAGDFVTVAGLVQDRLGRLPDAGDTLSVEGWTVQVLSVQGHSIEQVRFSPAPSTSNGEGAGDDAARGPDASADVSSNGVAGRDVDGDRGAPDPDAG